jgi:hypothetical protein
VKNIVLLSTRRLPPTYFDTVREDLGDADIILDVVGWIPPSGPVDDKVRSFTLLGPGKMPVELEADSDEDQDSSDPDDEGPDAVIAPEAVAGPETVVDDEAEVAPAAAQVAAGGSAAKPMPKGAKRVVQAVRWRYRRARRYSKKLMPKAIRRSRAVRFLSGNRIGKDLGKAYWRRVQGRRDVMETVEQADVVVALDAGAIWAGWNLGQRRASIPVVLGIPAARRELDQLKVPAGNG